MANITTLTNYGGNQAPADLAYIARSPFGATDDRKSTLDDLFAEITKNISDVSLQFGDGIAAAVSAVGKGKIRYNNTTKTFQASVDGGAYSDLSSGAANTALSNLASVAVNASVLPGVDNSINLGSIVKRWKQLFAAIWSNPGTDAFSEGFGASITNTGAAASVFGNQAAATGGLTVAFGASSAANGDHAAVFGALANAGLDSTALGYNVGANGTRRIGIGASASVGHDDALAIGAGATTTASNQAVLGSSTSSLTDWYFGKGVTNATPAAVTVNPTGGSGTNIAGVAFAIAGGKATGNAAGGGIEFFTSNAGASGTTLQSLTRKLTINNTGSLIPETDNAISLGSSSKTIKQVFIAGGINNALTVGLFSLGDIGSGTTSFISNSAEFMRCDSTPRVRIGSGMLSFGTDFTGFQDTGIKQDTTTRIKITDGAGSNFRDVKLNQLWMDQTLTAGGTTGAQTINKAQGSVNFAAAATSLVVTCNQCTTSSIVHCTLLTNDATAVLGAVVPAAGSFTINMTTAPTSETRVGFTIFNQ